MTTSPRPEPRYQKSRQRIPARKVLSDPGCFLAFGFGSGLSPYAPGTLGTLAGIPLYLLMESWALPLYGGTILGLFLVGIVICARSEERLGVSDHGGIVWDEIVGYLITMTAIPASWQTVALGFALFRLFDIIKPWPIRWLDRHVHGGTGVMLDDAVAGLFASLCLHAIRFWAPGFLF